MLSISDIGIQYFNIKGDEVLQSCANRLEESEKERCVDHIGELRDKIYGESVQWQKDQESIE